MQIPFYTQQVNNQVQSMPRGSMEVAGEPWKAVARAGEVIADIGDKAAQIGIKYKKEKEALTDHTAQAEYAATMALGQKEKNALIKKSKLSGTPIRQEDLDAINSKYAESLNGITGKMSERSAGVYTLNTEFFLKGASVSDKLTIEEQELTQNIKTTESSVRILVDQKDFNTAKEIVKTSRLGDDAKAIAIQQIEAEEIDYGQSNQSMTASALASVGKIDEAQEIANELKDTKYFTQTQLAIDSQVTQMKQETAVEGLRDAIVQGDQEGQDKWHEEGIKNGKSKYEMDKVVSDTFFSLANATERDTPEEFRVATTYFDSNKDKLTIKQQASVKAGLERDRGALQREMEKVLTGYVESKEPDKIQELSEDVKAIYGDVTGSQIVMALSMQADPTVVVDPKNLSAYDKQRLKELGKAQVDLLSQKQPTAETFNDFSALILKSGLPASAKVTVIDRFSKKMKKSVYSDAQASFDETSTMMSEAFVATEDHTIVGSFFDAWIAAEDKFKNKDAKAGHEIMENWKKETNNKVDLSLKKNKIGSFFSRVSMGESVLPKQESGLTYGNRRLIDNQWVEQE